MAPDGRGKVGPKKNHMTVKPKTKAPAGNVVPFPVTPDPAHKMAVQAAEKLFDGIEPIMMSSLRRQLAAAEAKAAFGGSEAAEEAEYFRLSIKLRLRDHEKTRASFVSKLSRIRR
jgi:hypothetical protein